MCRFVCSMFAQNIIDSHKQCLLLRLRVFFSSLMILKDSKTLIYIKNEYSNPLKRDQPTKPTPKAFVLQYE